MYLTSDGDGVGDALITGLPFTVNASVPFPVSIRLLQGVSYATDMEGQCENTTTTIGFTEVNAATGGVTTLTDADFADTARLNIAATYMI